MNENNGQTFLSFLIGLLVGGLVGAAVALLYAPQSGEETRAAIRDKSIELKDQAQQRIETLQAQAQQQLSSLQQQVSDLQARVQKTGAEAGQPPVAE